MVFVGIWKTFLSFFIFIINYLSELRILNVFYTFEGVFFVFHNLLFFRF